MGTQGTATDIVILSAVRTPFGTFGGTLRDVSAVDLTVVAAKAADEFALRSQQNTRDAWANGLICGEIVPVPVMDRKTKQPVDFARDEHARPDSTIESLAKLRPVFKADGVVTAGNASGLNDGAGALAVQKELGIPLGKFNLHGGAIAIGHALGASGARIAAHLTHALRTLSKKYALGSACIGGGQGIAVIL